MANSYGIGNGIRVSVKFKAMSTGAFVDPTVVKILIKDPSSNVTTLTYGVDPEVQKPSVGSYFFIDNGNEVGTWKYRWEGTGDNQAASEGSFIITASAF